MPFNHRKTRDRGLWGFLTLLILSAALACSSSSEKTQGFDQRFQRDIDQRPVLMPQNREVSDTWDKFYHHGLRQFYRVMDVPRHVDGLSEWVTGRSTTPAEDVNSWGEVADSSWFTNRLGKPGWGLSQLQELLASRRAPQVTGSLQVISGKVDGVSPGFVVRDSSQEIYFIKFDPPGGRELASGAEVVASLIYHAMGFNVPEYFAVEESLDRFVLAEGAKTRGRYGQSRAMTDTDLRKIIGGVDTYGEEKVRLSASRLIAGTALGPFSFSGLRQDDPNHRVINENRRSLRGFHVVSAWLNNVDIRAKNTLDVYVGPPGEGHVRHYFLDFGDALGSAGNRPKNEREGYEFFFDYRIIFENFLSFGFFRPKWLQNSDTGIEAVRVFEAEQFDPLRWRPLYSNPAFERISAQDAYWATKKILALTPEMLRLIVNEARYSEIEAREKILEVLIERRRKLAETWLSRITPVDEFSLERVDGKPNGWSLSFENLAEKYQIFSDSDWSVSVQPRSVPLTSDRVPGGEGLVSWERPQGEEAFDLELEFFVHAQVRGERQRLGDAVRVHLHCPNRQICRVAGIDR